MSETTPDPIATAEEFARSQEAEAAKRAHRLQVAEVEIRAKQVQGRVTMILSAVWGVVILGVAAGIAFLVWQVTSQHTQRDRDRNELKARQVTVWCYADPNTDRATSSFTGSASEVKGRCPDAYGR